MPIFFSLFLQGGDLVHRAPEGRDEEVPGADDGVDRDQEFLGQMSRLVQKQRRRQLHPLAEQPPQILVDDQKRRSHQ